MAHEGGELGDAAASIKGSRNLDRPDEPHVRVEHAVQTRLRETDYENALGGARQASKHSALSRAREARQLLEHILDTCGI